MSVHIGTSGWSYPHWRESFYTGPLARRQGQWLSHYADHFDCVEINSSFYRLPSPATVEQWLAQTPVEFLFTVKASRYITHMKKLKDCARPLADFLAIARLFSTRLGIVLFQLPPRWHADPGRLRQFLALLPQDLRFAMEFRDPSWHVPEVEALLRAHKVAFCQYDLAGFTTPCLVTTDLVYLRLHGPGEAYAGSYSGDALEAWASRIKAWDREGCAVYVFFDNDQHGYAVQNACVLRKLTGA